MNNQQLLNNFKQQGLVRNTVSLFGQELSASAGKVTAVNQMLASFGSQNKLRSVASIFGKTVAEIAGSSQAREAELVALINSTNFGHLAPA